MTELDQRWQKLIADGRASWRPGMLCVSITGSTWRLDECDDHGGQPPEDPDWSPDWQDPATLGALLGLVRERWPVDPEAEWRKWPAYLRSWEDEAPHFECSVPGRIRPFVGTSEVDVMLKALEAPNAD